MKNKKYLSFLLLIIISSFLLIGMAKYIATRYDEDHTFKSVNFNSKNQNSLNFLKGTEDSLNLEGNFFSKWILDSLQYPSFNQIMQVLNWMDSINQEKNQNQQLLASVLTDSLQNKLNYGFRLFNLDSLNAILLWAEKMKTYGEVDANYQLFFEVVSSYWINFVSNNLSKLSEDSSFFKYKFKFKFLVSRCAQNLNQPNVKVNNAEKIINYTIEGRYGYLWDRFINGTSIIFKTIVFVFGGILLFSFYCLFLFVRKKL